MENCQKKRSRQEVLNSLSPHPYKTVNDTSIISFTDSLNNSYKVLFNDFNISKYEKLKDFQLLEFSFGTKNKQNGHCAKIYDTICHILLTVFNEPNIIINIYCSTENQRSLARLKLFTKWFNKLGVKDYTFKSYKLNDNTFEYYGALLYNSKHVSDSVIKEINKSVLHDSIKSEI